MTISLESTEGQR